MSGLFKFNPSLKHYGLLILVACIAYWPFSFNVLSLKNDALVYFLPYRYNISEAIQNGSFPFWSPFIYAGLPLHADIQSGVWNPVVLLISLFCRYNLTVLQYETLFYIALGGIGFFKLCKTLKFEYKISLLLGSSYLCSGFFFDSVSFTPWITSAAYLPFVFNYYIRFLSLENRSASLKLAISLALLFLSGYVSYFIVSGYILFFVTVYTAFQNSIFYQRKVWLTYCKEMSLVAGIFMVLCAPAIASYVDFLPYYQRGSGTTLESANFNPFTLQNSLSFLLPHASYKLQASNDVTSRNIFLGSIPFLFFLFSLQYKFLNIQKTILTIVIICFLISLGNATPLRSLLYRFLPLMDSFRHPGTLRIFVIIGLLLLSGFGLKILYERMNFEKLRPFLYSTCIILVCVLFYFSFHENSVLQLFTNFSFSPLGLKEKLNQTTVGQWLILDALMQLICISPLFFIKAKKKILFLGILNLLFMAMFSLPFTTVSQFRTSKINDFVDSFPDGIRNGNLWRPVEFPATGSEGNYFGNPSFYSKAIMLENNIVTPTINNAYLRAHGDSSALNLTINKKPAYLDSGSVKLKAFSHNKFELLTYTTSNTILHLTQQYNHNWKAYVDKKPVPVFKDRQAFMRIEVPVGKHVVSFLYSPHRILILSFASLLTAFFCFIALYKAKESPFKSFFPS